MDYPGNLYFFLTQLILKLGNSGMIISIITGAVLILLLTFLSLAFNFENNFPQNKLPAFLWSNWFFLFTASVFILLQRLPFLLSGQLNTDEDLWIAGGATILDDPRFWISFNPTTSGPLVVLPVILAKILGLQINYTSVRLLALLFCILPSVILLFFSFRNLFNEKIARIIVLPLVICISFFHSQNYIAYNSEHVPILLTSLSLFIYSKIYRKGELSPCWWYLLLGITLGIFPFSKLQAVPIGFGIALVFAFTLFQDLSKKRKEAFKKFFFFLSGCFIPFTLTLIYLFAINAWKDFWNSYILSNLDYATYGLDSQISNWMKLRYFIYSLRTISDSSFYFISLFIFSFVLLAVLFILKRKELSNYRIILLMASVVVLGSYYGIVKPSNFYLHYFLLFMVPITFFFGAILGVFQKAFERYKFFRFFISFFIITTVLVPSCYCFARMSSLNLLPNEAVGLKKHSAAQIIEKYALPGEKIAIWGWMTDLYVQTGLIMGTRYGDSYHQFRESKLQSYYITNYLSDLKRNKPKIFVDVIRPDAFFFKELRYRHENYSMIDSYIKENYRMAGEVDQIRIYIRN